MRQEELGQHVVNMSSRCRKGKHTRPAHPLQRLANDQVVCQVACDEILSHIISIISCFDVEGGPRAIPCGRHHRSQEGFHPRSSPVIERRGYAP